MVNPCENCWTRVGIAKSPQESRNVDHSGTSAWVYANLVACECYISVHILFFISVQAIEINDKWDAIFGDHDARRIQLVVNKAAAVQVSNPSSLPGR